MFFLITAIILAVVIPIAFVLGIMSKSTGPFMVAGGLVVLLLVFTLFNSLTTVDARAVGIRSRTG